MRAISLTARRLEDGHVLRRQLERVSVRGGDEGVAAAFALGVGGRGQEVVGLVPRALRDREAEGLDGSGRSASCSSNSSSNTVRPGRSRTPRGGRSAPPACPTQPAPRAAPRPPTAGSACSRTTSARRAPSALRIDLGRACSRAVRERVAVDDEQRPHRARSSSSSPSIRSIRRSVAIRDAVPWSCSARSSSGIGFP